MNEHLDAQFWMSLGIVMGTLSKPSVQEYLKTKGVAPHVVIEHLQDVARLAYE